VHESKHTVFIHASSGCGELAISTAW